MQLFMGHIVSCLHLLKERIFFFMCIINLVFKFGLCLFTFPFRLNFSQNIFCFSHIIGREKFFFFFLNFSCSYKALLLFIGGVVSISYKFELFCVLFFLYFLLLYCVCFLFIFWLGSLCQYVTERERNRWNVGILFVL